VDLVTQLSMKVFAFACRFEAPPFDLLV